MDCNNIAKLLSMSFDDELDAGQSRVLEQHLRACHRCRIEQAVWGKYEHQMGRFYQSHRLDESFVARVGRQVAALEMEQADRPQPEISGRVHAPALRPACGMGLAAGVLLAALLFALHSTPFIGQLIDGSGYLLSSTLAGVADLGGDSQRDVQAGDLVWTSASQWLRIRLSRDVSVLLSERGLLTVEAESSARQGVVRLYSGKVVLGGMRNPGKFALNTAAGRIRGEAGRVDVTARWLTLAEKRWKASAFSESRVEGWKSVPIARVDVEHGNAEISTASGSTELVSGQSATVSTALQVPVLAQGQDTGAPVLVEAYAEPSAQPQIRSQLVRQQNRVMIETTFVQIPLHTVLSSIAGVSASHIELDPRVDAAPQSLRVVQPVDTPAEAALAALASFAGMTYQKQMRNDTADLVDVAPGSIPQSSASMSPQLTLEIEGNSLRLLKGSGVRLSTLSKALEDSLGRTIEPGSVDWALGEFELRDVPRDKMAEVLNKQLGLQFRRESRPSPFYRLQPAGGDKLRAPSRQRGRNGQESSRQDGGSANATEPSGDPENHPEELRQHSAFRSLSAREQRRWAMSSGRFVQGARERQGLKISQEGLWDDESLAFYNELADWMGMLAGWRDKPLRRGGQILGGSGTASLYLPGSGTGTSSATLNASASERNREGSQSTQPQRDLQRISQHLLRDWTRSAEFSRRLLFTALSVRAAAGRDRLALVFLAFANREETTVWVRADLKSPSGETLDSTYVEVGPQAIFAATADELFPGCKDPASASYVEAEAGIPVSGFETVLEDDSLALLSAQAISQHRRYFAPLVAVGNGADHKADTVLKLVNSSDLYHNVQVSLLFSDGTILEPLSQWVLAPHAAHEFSLVQMLAAAGHAVAGAMTAGLWIDSDQAGLVGHIWRSASEAVFGPTALPLQRGLSTEWRFWLDSWSVYPSATEAPRVALLNLQESPVNVWLEIRDSQGVGSSQPLQRIDLPGRATQIIQLPDGIRGAAEAFILVRASAPIAAQLF